MNETTLQRSSEDVQGLLRSLRGSAETKIAALATNCEQQLQQLQETADAEIELFERDQARLADAAIAQETARLRNRGTIDRKKARLASVETFISDVAAEACAQLAVSTNDAYRAFIRRCLERARTVIQTDDAVVSVSPQHRGLVEQLLQELRLTIPVREDPLLLGGGIIVDDRRSRRRLNWSLNRILYRKFSRIRQAAYAVIAAHATGAEKERDSQRYGPQLS